MIIWVTSSNWKQIKYSWNIYIQFAKFDECINTFSYMRKKMYELCFAYMYIHDISLLGLVACQADHISFEVLDWLVCDCPWLLCLTELHEFHY